MAYRRKDDKASSKDPNIITAVEFLNEVHDKGHKESDLRKYLLHRRGLTKAQVNEAFRIHNIRIDKNQKVRRVSQELKDQKSEMDKVWNASQEDVANKEEMMVNYKGFKGSAECLEVSTSVNGYCGPKYLRAENRIVGQKLIKDFLVTEYRYIRVLECLQDEYWKELRLQADLNKIALTRSDLHDIFQRIPDLLNFHRVYYQNLSNSRNNIAHIFIRVFSCFKIYVEYMKDCTCMINKIRVHIHDKKLHRVLEQIRVSSKRPNDCLGDLLLLPLHRISDYKEFLDKLYDWADKNQEADYAYLGKALRRIGRITNYIGKYKGDICNRNEMNTVQQFLGKQCNIINNKRRIIRRGLMIRRTTGWPARKKKYVFFLFSDLLLWTSRKGEFQNVVRLCDCEVMPSDAKNNRDIKFKIVSAGRHGIQKTLLLECNLVRQRNQWFTAVSQAIEATKQSPENEIGKTIGEDIEWFLSNTEPDRMFTTPPPYTKNIIDEELKNEDSRAESVLEEESDIPISGLQHRYNLSQNFTHSEFFQEFGPLDDTLSVTSEDQELHWRRVKYGGSMHQLFPNMVSSKVISRSDTNNRDFKYQEDSMKTATTPAIKTSFSNLEFKETNLREVHPNYYSDDGQVRSKTPIHPDRPSATNLSIIRREKRYLSKKNGPLFETGSCFTIRLGGTAL